MWAHGSPKRLTKRNVEAREAAQSPRSLQSSQLVSLGLRGLNAATAAVVPARSEAHSAQRLSRQSAEARDVALSRRSSQSVCTQSLPLGLRGLDAATAEVIHAKSEALRARASCHAACNPHLTPYVVRELDIAAAEVAAARTEAKAEDVATDFLLERTFADANERIDETWRNAAQQEAAEAAEAKVSVMNEFAAAAEEVHRITTMAMQEEAMVEADSCMARNAEEAEFAAMRVHVSNELAAAAAESSEALERARAEKRHADDVVARTRESAQSEVSKANAASEVSNEQVRALERKLAVQQERLDHAVHANRGLERRLAFLDDCLSQKGAQLGALLQQGARAELLGQENKELEAELARGASERAEHLEEENNILRAALLDRAGENEWLRQQLQRSETE
mmetsp:Transcript_900/g.2150  ORF Transcript_900/g.2150 Transcript_900/m.2150 type:complete len:397 (+) Transcript_900:100-1290(+)